MEVNFAPGLQAEIDEWAIKTGRTAQDLVADAMAAHLAELSEAREMLDRRYDELVSGQVQGIDGEEAFTSLMAKTEASRSRRS